MNEQKSLSYRDAGVDIDAGAELVDQIKPDIARTNRPGVLGGIGGFGGLFELPVDRYQQPVLVSGADGVGTKLLLANLLNHHHTIGVDLVAMCVNDILVCGAEPLFFLDYYATGKLDIEKSRRIISGIADGCELSGAALIGGETAEMPGMYDTDDYDLAGFAVGVVEKKRILDKNNVAPGHIILGLASSGCHSNGYSLVRKVLEVSGDDPAITIGNDTLANQLMAPTRIYVKAILDLLSKLPVAAMAHITGGGITENIPRSLPNATTAVIQQDALPAITIFDWLQKKGSITDDEMRRTFNCGIGMAIIIAPGHEAQATTILRSHGETVIKIGHIKATDTADKPQLEYL